MAKARKSKSVRRAPHGKTSKTPKTQEQIQNARTQITNVIVDASVEMTKRVTQYVSENGNSTALKFLWEIAGLFPKPEGEYEEDEEPDGRSVMEQLGLYEGLPPDETIPEGDVKSRDLQNAD